MLAAPLLAVALAASPAPAASPAAAQKPKPVPKAAPAPQKPKPPAAPGAPEAQAAAPAAAGVVVVTLEVVDAKAKGGVRAIGTVTLADTPQGLQLKPDLAGLTPLPHGLHVHEKASCAAGTKDGKKIPFLGAGGHLDPAKTGKHEGPYREGHLGDLPMLVVGLDGRALIPVVAPRLKLADVRGRSLVLHAGADSYDDSAEEGGGGERIACGVVPK